MAFVRRTLQRISHRLTRQVGIRFGEVFPFWYVSEFPRSGGTWLGRMVADYLDLPFAELSVFPMGLSCVNFTHWPYHPRLRRCFYIYRDGRDVMVSFYFYRMSVMRKNPNTSVGRSLGRRYREAFGRGFDPDDSLSLMGRFVELEMTRPGMGQLNWPQHIANWYVPGRKNVAFLSYEQLRNDPRETLETALRQFLDEPVDASRLQRTVQRYGFERMSGRPPGDEDRHSFFRKGTVGDWRNHFTAEAAAVFDQYAGDTLVRLGYEPDHSWADARNFPP
jgi:hypothetical protein